MTLNTFSLYLFGGTGDLSNRKLLPAMFRQEILSTFDEESEIVGIGSKEISTDEYISMVKESLSKYFHGFDDHADSWAIFSKRLRYIKLDINSEDDWINFQKLPEERSVILYLATPPFLYKTISNNLKSYNLVNKNCRVVVEKPLGTNLETSNDINDSLAQGFEEHQIYRIDHYLGKEAVQNLLALRFGNTIFERSWSNAAIDHIQITVAEDLGVEGRGDYYDDTGALKGYGTEPFTSNTLSYYHGASGFY